MKKKFSKTWNKSKRPGKKRKYVANAPLHVKKNFMRVNLSKELRKKYEVRNVSVRKGDTVEVRRGKFKKKKGKVNKIFLKEGKLTVEKVQVQKQDGSKVDVKLQPSNLKVVELNLEDRKRKMRNKKEVKSKKVEEKPKTKSKKVENKESKK